MRVYNRVIGGTSWASVEDYLPAGNALGYDASWQVELDTNTVMMAGFGEGLQVAIAYQDSFGVDLSPAMTPCVEQVVAPAIVQPCPPLGSGDGCEEARQQLAIFALFPCALPQSRACTPPERQQCSRCCSTAGAIMVDCTVWPDGKMLCICQKECTQNDWAECDRECQRKGLGRATSCAIISSCENGKLGPPLRGCRCERQQKGFITW